MNARGDLEAHRRIEQGGPGQRAIGQRAPLAVQGRNRTTALTLIDSRSAGGVRIDRQDTGILLVAAMA